jgi:hypothetical protein
VTLVKIYLRSPASDCLFPAHPNLRGSWWKSEQRLKWSPRLSLERTFAAISSVFGFLALLLACLVLYGTNGVCLGMVAATLLVTMIVGYIPARRASQDRVDLKV